MHQIRLEHFENFPYVFLAVTGRDDAGHQGQALKFGKMLNLLIAPLVGQDLLTVLFQQAAGIKLNGVPYRGAGPAIQGLLGGDVHMMFVDYATARSHIAAGTLKALGVAALTPRPELPGVPPVAAVPGLGGFEAWPWQGFALPAKTPDAIIVKLRNTYVAAVADPIVHQKVIDAGAELLQSSSQEMADYMRKEAAKWAEVIRAADIQLD